MKRGSKSGSGSGSSRQGSEQSSGIQVSAASLARVQQPSCGASSDGSGNKTSGTKLVFGLGSKTNRLKHDEYAEKRQATKVDQTLISGTGNYDTLSKSAINRSPSPGKENSPLRRRKSLERADESLANQEPISQRDNKLQRQIRASKYGNFYKPQDLVVSGGSKPVEQSAAKRSLSSERASGTIESTAASAAAATVQHRSKSPARASVSSLQQPDRESSALQQQQTKEKQVTTKQSSIAMKEANSLPSSQTTKEASVGAEKRAHEKVADSSNNKPVASNRSQFSIPPPPQMSSIPGGKGGSVVSYAKSRIYDKPARQSILLHGSGSLLDSGTIPASILSGRKPPKQVNVTKARERWEGGEPFAKCKSRQRLARQAGKRLIPGVWSMSSVVANSQMQLQQAISNANQSSGGGTNRQESSVKILTRGSVLERVQQYERVPSSSSSTGSDSSGSSTSSGESSASSSPSSPSSPVADINLGENRFAGATEASLASNQPLEPVELRVQNAASPMPGSKQAQYKHRVSSIQISNDSPTIFSPQPSIISPKSPLSPPVSRQRYGIAVRRRSSAQSSAQQIPKFYHPFGKPNTYEIELQKKNIVACFDKFPDRKASLTGPSYRRHFHSIALACGFSEYFKEPLYLYVKHQMTQSNLLHSPANRSANRQHRPSGVGLAMVNGAGAAACGKQASNVPASTVSSSARRNPLIRAASIDNSTMEKIQNQTFITCDQFLVCWRELIATAFDNPARFVHLLALGQRNYLLPDDFVPMLQSIIQDHPGLEFLRAAPDFHMRYIQTVIARIYFNLNKSWTGKISLAELRQSNLLAVVQVLSQEDDINQVTDYFSYEHFYVIYCKFWSLDQDHDLMISKEDLARHNDAAISSRIIDRIFMGIVSKQIQKTGKMSYSDFVWFLIAEEDKKHPRSIEYWFRLMDIDGDGYISMYEMEYFYYEQVKRLELMNIEALPFIDSACQILDLVNPKEKNKISLADLKRTKMATIFFDTFINLEKYLEHESREFVSTRDVVQDGVVISDWDRYASEEYESLVTEESTV